MATATDRTSDQLGRRLKAEREQRSLSQETVAKRAAIGVRTLIRVEQGFDAKHSTIAAICKAMGLSLGDVTDS